MSEQQPYVEPEETQQPPIQEYNPLSEPVNEKPYSRPNVNMKAEDLLQPIPEPDFIPPPPPQDEEQPKGPPKPPPPPVNPVLKDLPKKDKALAASHAANMCIQGYEFINEMGNKYLLQFSEKKMEKRYMTGEINRDLVVGRDVMGNIMTVPEYISEFNQSASTTLSVSEEFKEEVRPILERVLEKKGAGMTDEQMLMFIVGKDLTYKMIQVIGIRGQMKELITALKDQTEAIKNSAQAHSAPPPPAPQPQYEQPVQYEQAPHHEEFEVEYEEHVEHVPDTAMGVNDFVEKATNPDGYNEKTKKKPGRPSKAEREARIALDKKNSGNA